jgi:hypothetical protein
MSSSIHTTAPQAIIIIYWPPKVFRRSGACSFPNCIHPSLPSKKPVFYSRTEGDLYIKKKKIINGRDDGE